jgi:hypothetical protein
MVLRYKHADKNVRKIQIFAFDISKSETNSYISDKFNFFLNNLVTMCGNYTNSSLNKDSLDF